MNCKWTLEYCLKSDKQNQLCLLEEDEHISEYNSYTIASMSVCSNGDFVLQMHEIGMTRTGFLFLIFWRYSGEFRKILAVFKTKIYTTSLHILPKPAGLPVGQTRWKISGLHMSHLNIGEKEKNHCWMCVCSWKKVLL